MNYIKFIENRFKIVNKQGDIVPFILNEIQRKYLEIDATGHDIILKARQQGFSSLILAMFTADFLLKENSRSVIVADISENATELLDRVKFYLKTYEDITKIKVPLKYNSKYELFNESMNSRYTIGTADNADFGRSKTITNLHLSEAAFYMYLDKIIAGAGQTVVENGRFIIETTANGFNYFRDLWYESEHGETTFKPLFYKASDFYSQEFLDNKKKELKTTFKQEYPDTAEEAFLTSGESFFNTESLRWYLENVKTIQTI
jgi:hypothetical protein